MTDGSPAPEDAKHPRLPGPQGPGSLLHLAVAGEWERAQRTGTYERSTIDTSLEEEGFIHCSFPHQVQGTADRYYRGRDDIVLLRIDPDRVGAEVRVEEASDGDGYPHVYGPIPVDAVTSVSPVPMGADGRLDLAELSG